MQYQAQLQGFPPPTGQRSPFRCLLRVQKEGADISTGSRETGKHAEGEAGERSNADCIIIAKRARLAVSENEITVSRHPVETIDAGSGTELRI